MKETLDVWVIVVRADPCLAGMVDGRVFYSPEEATRYRSASAALPIRDYVICKATLTMETE